MTSSSSLVVNAITSFKEAADSGGPLLTSQAFYIFFVFIVTVFIQVDVKNCDRNRALKRTA